LVAQHRAEMADRRHGVGVGVSIDTAEHQQRLPGTIGVGQRDSFGMVGTTAFLLNR
jgi:hypothetical protein